MQLVLERRAERSTLIAVASPLAVALTIGTFAILFAIMGTMGWYPTYRNDKNPPAGALAS